MSSRDGTPGPVVSARCCTATRPPPRARAPPRCHCHARMGGGTTFRQQRTGAGPDGIANPNACAGAQVPPALAARVGGDVRQTEKLEPQPQVDFAVGLLNLKPAPYSPST